MSATEPQPYKVAVTDAELDLLKRKLEVTRLPDEIEPASADATWKYGAPLADVRRLVAHWQNGFDWRAQEARLNEELPQFTVDVDVESFGPVNVHFVHKKGEVENAVPLLFVHGWPGSFIEVRKILSLLTSKPAEGDGPSFHVVAPSLPNFGFSAGIRTSGFGLAQYAEVAHKLMLKLGYNEYVTQGGDWGYFITRQIATTYGPTHTKAWHTNSTFAGPPRPLAAPLAFLKFLLTPWSAAERAGIERTQAFRREGSGYMIEQSTAPQTLGYSLADSPAGLLAWVYEKLVRWTDGYEWTDDEVLTWISIYWFSRAGPAASVRIYYEAGRALRDPSAQPYVGAIPLGVSIFPREIVVVPKSWMNSVGRVVFTAEHDGGGHFAAHERPAELVGDLRRLFGKGGPAYGVVSGKDGY